MKKLIDIEKLLQWAMRDELPKGQAVSSSPWDLIRQFAQLGVRVQTSAGGADGFGFVPGAPHEDALIVAAAIDMLDTSARFESAAEILGLFGDLAAIAGDSIEPIRAMRFNPQAIVMSKALMGNRPSWDFEQPSPYPILVEYRDPKDAIRSRASVSGVDACGASIALKPRVARGKAAMKGLYDINLAPRCPLQWNDPSLTQIGNARAEYVAWHGALVSLAASLKGKLAEFEPMSPAARPAPWRTGLEFVSRVLSDGKPGTPLDDLDAMRLPVVPKRHSGGRPIESKIVTESRPRENVLRRARAIKQEKRELCL